MIEARKWAISTHLTDLCCWLTATYGFDKLNYWKPLYNLNTFMLLFSLLLPILVVAIICIDWNKLEAWTDHCRVVCSFSNCSVCRLWKPPWPIFLQFVVQPLNVKLWRWNPRWGKARISEIPIICIITLFRHNGKFISSSSSSRHIFGGRELSAFKHGYICK